MFLYISNTGIHIHHLKTVQETIWKHFYVYNKRNWTITSKHYEKITFIMKICILSTFYIAFISYSKSILSLFTHKSHDAAEHGRIHPWCLGSALSMIFFCFYLRIICYLTISPISLLLVQMCLWYYLNIVNSMKCFYILIWETVKIIYLSYFYETLRWTL